MSLNIEKEQAKLEKMTAWELAEKYAELYGERTRSNHRAYLVRKILWRMQTNEQGTLSERARKRAEELAANAELRTVAPKTARPVREEPTLHKTAADQRLPLPGGSIVRNYKGQRYEVIVRENGFEMEGEMFPSLSAVAKKITGTHCNGFRFFRLTEGVK